MPKIRSIPFGYEMQDGEIVPQAEQAKLVQQIFAGYLNGIPILEIVRNLNLNQIPYDESQKTWNKNRIYRILEDKRYLGQNGFPAIVAPNDFEQVARKREKGPVGKIENAVHQFRHKIVCQKCGNPLARESDRKKKTGKIYWHCPFCESKTTLSDEVIVSYVEHCIQRILDDPVCAMNQRMPPQYMPLETAKLVKEFDRLVSSPNLESEKLLIIAQQIASNDYASCDAGTIQAENEWLDHLIRQAKVGEIDDNQFIRQAVHAISLSPNGQISVELINNKIL